MVVISGSLNKTKIAACKVVFPEYLTVGEKVPSNVSAQPLSDEETRQGALNRARNAVPHNGLSIGLEGGVMCVEGELYLCNWGALATSTGKIYTASGARIILPEIFKEQLANKRELSAIMEDYSKRSQVRSKEGAVGIFTNKKIDRTEMFTHVVKLLRGQWEYWSLKSK